jgi:UDP-glucose 4-epimerase
MKILVTGGRGFIGSHLVKRLESSNHSVEVLDMVDGNNIMSKAVMREYFNTCPEVVVHLAALTSVSESFEKSYKYFMNNAVGTYKVVDFSNNYGSVRRVVYAATAASLEPHSSPYAFSKWIGEESLNMCKRETVALRFFNVVGDGQNKNYMGVIPRFKEFIKRGVSLTIYGDGEQTRDFVSVEDVVEAIVLAIEKPLPKPHMSFQIGSGEATTINEVAKRLIGKKSHIKIVYEPAKPEVRHSKADITEARKVLGYEPRHKVFV